MTDVIVFKEGVFIHRVAIEFNETDALRRGAIINGEHFDMNYIEQPHPVTGKNTKFWYAAQKGMAVAESQVKTAIGSPRR